MTTVFIYSFTFLSSILLTYVFDVKVDKNEKLPYPYIILLSLLPSITAGVRYGIGTDYFNYVEHNILIGNSSLWASLEDSREPLYILLQYFSSFFYNGPQVFLFLAMFISIYFIMLGANNFRNQSSMSLVMFIYLAYYYIEGFNIVRQTIAISIIFYSLKFIIKDRNFVKYLFWVMIATMFHNTALIFLFFFFLPYKKPEKIKSIVSIMFFYCCLAVILLFPIQFLNVLSLIPAFEFYLIRYSFNLDSSVLSSALRLGPMIIIAIFFLNKLIKQNPNYYVFISWIILSICLTTFLINIPYGWRIQYYLALPQLIIGSSVFKIYNLKSNALIMGAIVCAIYILFFYIYYIVLGSGPGIPYQSIF
jgi:hypothetical protein